MKIRLGIIIPAYNEERIIRQTLEEYYGFFIKKKQEKEIDDFEIIVILNACKDNTLRIVMEFQEKFKEIRFLDFEQGGKGFAVTEGFKDALTRNNDLIGFVDADLATSPEAFYNLVMKIGNYDGIIASRWLKGSIIKTKQPFLRRITSRGFNFLTRSFFLFHYKDTQCGAKLFKKKVIEEITPKLNLANWAFDVNLLYLCKKNKFKIKETPTVWKDQINSKINLMKTPIQMFLGIVRLRLIYSFFEPILRPVKFLLYFGDKLLNKKL